MVQHVEGRIGEGLKKLHSLKAHTFHALKSNSIYTAMRESAKTLRSLSLGDTAAMAYPTPAWVGRSTGPAILEKLAVELADPIGHAPLNVHHLEFIGLNIQCDSWEEEFCNVFNATNLQSLSLLFCNNLDAFLDSLRAFCSVEQAPVSPVCNLTSLTLQLEDVLDGTVTAMEGFLTSFHGLHHLYILLDGSPRLLDVAVITGNHGSTLKTLVIDARKGVQTNPYAGTAILISKDPKESSRFGGIVEGCPGLVELGIAIDWRVLPEVRWKKVRCLF